MIGIEINIGNNLVNTLEGGVYMYAKAEKLPDFLNFHFCLLFLALIS